MKINRTYQLLKYLSIFLIILGAALVAAVSVYEAVNYPWFPKELADELPSPDFPISDNPDIVFTPYAPDNQETIPINSESTSHSTFVPILTEEKAPGTYTVLGSIRIPKINISVNLLEGVDSTQLVTGVGHVVGTPLPGQAGNCIIAGHRLLVSMHPFRHLDKLAHGDKIHISFNGNAYVYEVYDDFVVTPDSVWVMEDIKDEPYSLTLITCETIYNPVDRLIVRARLIKADTENH